MSLTFTDIFCGAGGSSTGLVAAGFELKLAANHSKVAIETHSANHRQADHICADVNNYDMRRLPHTDVLWASPICTEMSPAGGTQRRHGGQLAFGEDADDVEPEAFVRTRATAYDVIRATEVHRYKAVLCENVVEFATQWPLFDWWRSGMEQLGYTSQVVSVSSAHVGGPDNLRAPQWRDRIYIVFTRNGIKTPDVRPRPLAWCPECGEDVQAIQAFRNPRRHIGKYRQQYDYRCPNARCRNSIVEPYVRAAADAINWTDLGTRIGDRKRPLAAATMRRIAAGLAEYPQRVSLLTLNHGGHDGRAQDPTQLPLPARTRKIGEGLLFPKDRHGMLVPAGGTWNDDGTPLTEPMRTRTTRDTEALVTMPYVVTLRRNGGAAAVDQPLATVTAAGRHHGLVIPYRKGTAKPTSEPLLTLATRDSAGILTPDPALTVEDCHFRMLQPREQLAAQRFPADYIMRGTKGEQTMQAGNAVSCNVAQWIGERIAAVL